MTGTSVVLPRHTIFDHAQLARPLPAWNPKRYWYASMRRLLGSVGAWSDGIALGERYGFDSGVMLDYVYRNEASGKNVIGRVMDSAFLNAPGWQGIRDRGALVQSALDKEIAAAHLARRDLDLLDVACGGGRYVVETLARHPGKVASAQLRDYRLENIDSARALARKLGVNAHFAQADAFDGADLGRVAPKPNLIIVSGLHEIIPDDALVERHFRQIAAIAARPATLIFTIQPWHPQLEFIARVLRNREGKRWIMRRRSTAEIDELVRSAGFEKCAMEIDRWGMFSVSVARRAT